MKITEHVIVDVDVLERWFDEWLPHWPTPDYLASKYSRCTESKPCEVHAAIRRARKEL